jgi:multiple sugar transport system substrate-binding protein
MKVRMVTNLRRRSTFDQRYENFVRSLRDQIVTGQLKPGDFILSEHELADLYELSRGSVRKALSELVSEGLLLKIAGRGNMVTYPRKGDIRLATIKLGWFSPSYELPVVRQLLQRFEEQFPMLRVQLVPIPTPEYVETLMEWNASETVVDVFVLPDFFFLRWVQQGWVHQLHPYLPEDMQREQSVYPPLLSMFQDDGVQYATPFVFSPVVIGYHRRMWEEAGIRELNPIRDWMGLVETARRCSIRSPDGKCDQYGFCFSASRNRWPVFLLQNGGRLADASGRLILDHPRNVEALRFCVDMMYQHRVAPVFSHGSDRLAEDLFMRGRAAMILTTYFFMNEFRYQGMDWDLLPPPMGREEATLLLGNGLAINANSPNRAAAEALVDFLTSREAQSQIKRQSCTIPAHKDVAEDRTLWRSDVHPEHYHVFIDVLPYARSIRDLGVTEEQFSFLENELHLMWACVESPDVACRRITEEWCRRSALPTS